MQQDYSTVRSMLLVQCVRLGAHDLSSLCDQVVAVLCVRPAKDFWGLDFGRVHFGTPVPACAGHEQVPGERLGVPPGT